MASNIYTKETLTGGAAGALDEIAFAELTNGDMALVITDTNSYTYYFDSTSSASELSPNIIKPDDAGAGVGRWILIPASTIHKELSADPSDPADGSCVTWLSDGTDSGNDGDLMIKTNTDGSIRTQKLDIEPTYIANVMDYGATGDGTGTGDQAAFVAAFAAVAANTDLGGIVYVPAGNYKLTATITNDRSSDATVGRVDLRGESIWGTKIDYSGTGACFEFFNNATGTGAHSSQLISDFTLTGPSRASSSFGIRMDIGSYPEFARMYIYNFDFGIYTEDVDQATFYTLNLNSNNYGIFGKRSTSPARTRPNNWNFFGCTIANNLKGAGWWVSGSHINFYGGDIEYNGTNYSVDTLSDNGGEFQVETVELHTLTTGDLVTIEGVLGATGANGTWAVTVIDTSNFTLDSSTYGAGYTSGGIIRDLSTYGLLLTDSCDQGGIGFNCNGVYFEGNKGRADVVITNASNAPSAASDGDVIHTFTNCHWKRMPTAAYNATYHIYANFGAPATYGKQQERKKLRERLHHHFGHPLHLRT